MLRRFVVVGLVTLALGGCGGGGADETSSAPPATAAPATPAPPPAEAPALSFFEEGLPASGWEATEQHTNEDQFGYRNENRQFSKDDDGATVTVWFPEEEGNEPFVTIDYFSF